MPRRHIRLVLLSLALLAAPLVLALAVAGCGASGMDAQDQIGSNSYAYTTICPSGAVTYGLDVSSYQSVNWSTVASSSGRKFGYAKATEGTGWTDPTFAGNWSGMKGHGILRGAYHFFHPSESGTAQADYFINEINAAGGLSAGDLPPMLDWEVTDSVSNSTDIANAQAFLNEVKSRTGRAAIIYTYPAFWDGLGNPNFNSYPFWIANYGPSCPSVPSPWTGWKIWQYSSTASIAGVSPSGTDADEFNGSLSDMVAWAGGGAPYDATWAGQSYPADMTSGDIVTAYLEYHNTGTKTWDGNTRVGTTVARDRSSVFVNSDWIGANRPTAVDRSTAPGSVGRFTFKLHAPEVTKDTTYTEHWGLVQEGVTWFGPPDADVWFKITVHPRYTADYVSESYPSDMVSGQVAMAEIDMKNTGSTTWDTTGTHLGTQGPQDRASDFYDPVSWSSASRPTAVSASTAPGAVGKFYFTLRAPSVQQDTTYVEHWGVVQEGVAWVKTTDVYFTITVHPASASRPAPTAPAAAGSAPAAYMSGGCSATPGTPSGDGPAVLVVLAILGLAARHRHAR